MTYFTLHRTLAVINLAVLLVLSVDTFLLPKTSVREIYDRRYSVDAGGYRYHNNSSDYIKAVSGDEFQVPDSWQYKNIGLNEGDTFYVERSALFGQSINMVVHWHGDYKRLTMGFLNNNFWGRLLALYILLVSLLHLLPWQLIKNDSLNERFIFSGTALLLVLLFFFFYH